MFINFALLLCFISMFHPLLGVLEKMPIIITKEGNVILEAGANKNISIVLRGRSRLIINDIDLVDTLTSEKIWMNNTSIKLPIDGVYLRILQDDVLRLKTRVFGRGGLSGRLRLLQNRTQGSSINTSLRRTQRRVSNLESRVQSLFRTLKLDNCKSNPCENGGSCVGLFDRFLCKCTKGFEGLTCTTDVNECALYAGTDIGCQNDSQCINQFGSYSCICNTGWQGIHCNQRKTDCLHSSNLELCGHGTCVNTNDNFGYRCICEQGWKSNGLTPSCNIDVDECREYSNPCSTKCINLPGGFMCSPCEAGYTGNGLSCRDIDECALDNGGCSMIPFVPCINTYGSFHCGECPIGWVGDGRMCTRSKDQLCATNKICHPAALCQEISSRVVCSCPIGLIGNGIGPNGCLVSGNNMCSSNPCLNGGSCMDTGNNLYTCICPIGFKLPNCELSFSPCASNPCRNGGTCRVRGTTFKCSCITGYVGRLCDSQRSRCGQYISSDKGNLKYPLNNLYNHNAQCSWVIRTDEAKVLNITFSKFEIEDSVECRFDWLQLHDGPTAASQLIGRFCGLTAPLGGNIITTTNRIYIWFKSDNSTAKAGFELSWSSIEPICGGIIEFTSHTTIASPGSPGNYPRNRDCKWHLKTANTKRIKLVFFSLQIETHSNCNHDYLEILDAISTARLEIFCNSSNPAPLTVPSNEIILHFHSDNEDTDLGFQIHASTVERVPGCGGTFTERSGYITSPTSFEGRISCEYTIRYPKGIKVQLEVTEFEMGNDDCIEIFEVNSGNKISNGKWCGKMEVPMMKSIGNEIQLNYYSKGGTFKISYGTICEFNFEESSGVITSPNYPAPYPSDESCIYEIIGDINQVVSLEFLDFDVESHEGIHSCWFDYILIADGSNETAAGPFCGTDIPPKFISHTNLVKLKLQADRSLTGRGFKANYTLLDNGGSCGGVMRKFTGEIKLPSGSALGQYQHDLTCFWTITAPEGYGIQLSWISFKLEESSDCMYDYVEIYETDKITSEILANGKFCGTTIPPALVSASNILTLKFNSDSSEAEDGFIAKYNFVKVSSLCGGNIISSTGRIKSPNWPNDYPSNLNCSWSISVQPGYQIELIVKSMDLETSDGCEKDWIEIRNGGSGSSPLIGKYCGQIIPNRMPSFTHQIHINFKTNSQISKSGFNIEWQKVASGCGGILTSDHGSISSPSYPQSYSNDVQCEWRISVHKGSTILITFEDLSLETLLSCTYDFVDVYDGATSAKRKIGRYCQMPNKDSINIETSGSDALIRFQSDSSNTDRGFYLNYVTNCNQILNATFGIIESPNFGDNNPSNVNCTWTIKAPEGNKIELDFALLGRKENDQKPEPVYFKDDGNINVFKITKPRRIQSNGDTVQVWTNSSSTYFRLEYELKGCIQRFHRSSGEFTSPEYPNVYPNQIGCLWYIETEMGKAVELTFSNLDIENSPNCTDDGIKVYNSAQRNHLIGTFCGQHDNVTVTSNSHTLFVHFYSDFHINGKGFTAKYTTVNSKCGGKFAFTEGFIYSPNYPNNYDSNIHCEWLLEVTVQSSMKLTIEELDIEDSYQCSLDALRIYDGSEADSSNLLKTMCGDQIPSNNVFQSTFNTVLLVFDTDADTEYKGFKISFKEDCGKRIIVNDTGSIKFSGSNQNSCLWVLVSEDTTKRLTFTTTHVQMAPLLYFLNMTENECAGVFIFDGDIDFTNTTGIRPKQKFCNKHPPAVTSLGHTLTIGLLPHSIAEFEGFFSILDNNCGGKFDSLHGTFASPSYPTTYPVNIECIWEISASDGNSLSLIIENMEIDETENCNADYLEVREGNSEGRLIGAFCGDDEPDPIVALKSLWIKFYSDNENVRSGFIAEYSYALHTELNGTSGTIESPKYPNLFVTTIGRSWRILVPREDRIMIIFDFFFETYRRFTKFFNGYDDKSESVEYTGSSVIRSDTNVLFIKSFRGVFKLHWYKVSKEFIAANETSISQLSGCSDNIIYVGLNTSNFKSPGFPHGYNTNLNCNWTIVPVDSGSHAVVKFLKIDLENDNTCTTDQVIIYSSIDMSNWKRMDSKCKMKLDSYLQYSSDKFLKVQFVSDFAVNKTGFEAIASAECGSTLTSNFEIINATRYPIVFESKMNCIWKIQVKKGRKIKITFLQSLLYIKNGTNTLCRTNLLLKNGNSEQSPNLGSGKYCDNNLRDIPITSSNEAYIKFNYERVAFAEHKLVFKYEEVMNDCSFNILLDEEHSSAVIKSENYPNIPNSHIKCMWKIRAPAGHLLAVNFMDPMDLKQTDLCDIEYVALHDGASELSPLIGQFCGKITPNTQYSTGNILKIIYFTDITEPHIGFMANISLNICGGIYRLSNGTISAPTSLGWKTFKKDISCDYVIIVAESTAINLTVNNVNLPWALNCSEVNHLKITPMYSDDTANADPIIICGDSNRQTYFIDTNKVRISYVLEESDFHLNAFKFTYSAIGHQCGRTIEAESGVLKSPGYLSPIRFPTRCIWKIIVPKGRRIKIDFLEYNMVDMSPNITNRMGFRVPGRLVLANDLELKSIISRISGNPPAILYSSDNLISIVSFEVPTTQKQGFKLRFSSNEESIFCNNDFNSVRGDINFRPPENISVYCRYNINVNQNETIAFSLNKIEVNNAIFRDIYFCIRHGPISIQGLSGEIRMQWPCGNRNQSTIRLPYPVMFDMLSNSQNKLKSLDLKFVRHNCGGVYVIENEFQLMQPTTFNASYGTIDCAWRVLSNPDDLDQFEVTVSVNFRLKCDEEFLIIYGDSAITSPHLGRFCDQMTVSNLIAMKDLLIEYHTSMFEIGSTFNLTATIGTGCGGELTYPFRIIEFRKQYQNNIECIWTIKTQKEYHIGLKFSGRFFIESSLNCTKDYILIQEKVALDKWTDIQRICGREPPKFVNTTTNIMRFIFRSDESGIGDGFTANFDRNCGGIFYSTQDVQLISSPNYPSAYDYNLTCNYTIYQTDPNKSILIQLTDFVLEDSPTGNCDFDNLTVYIDSNDPTVLCGSNREQEFRSMNPISLVFKSDGSYSRKGFLLQFSYEMCGGNVTTSTTIATPKQRANSYYPSNAICVWYITAPEGSKIVIKFEQFEFEGSRACSYDYVEVFSGKVPSEDQRVARLCSNLTGKLPPFSINSNVGIIQSVSDQSEPSMGFVALISLKKNCDKSIELRNLTDRYTLDDFASGYENDLDCRFLFKTSPDHQLVLEFSTFHIEESSDCNNDFVQIRDGSGLFADEIAKFCGHIIPNPVMSSKSSIYIHFVTDGMETSSGFSASVKVIKKTCGAHDLFVHGNESIVISFGSETNYPPNSNCFWRLRSDSNLHLNFEKLDIQGPDVNGTCITDYLKIYNKEPYSVLENNLGSDVVFNGGSLGNSFLNTYSEGDFGHVFCGNDVPEGYYTNNQEIYIKFFSDSTIEKTGFKIVATSAQGCFKNYTSMQGRILFETAADCNVFINVPKNYSLSIYFNNLYFFFGETECKSTFIEIFDESVNSTSISKLCGSVDPSNSVFTYSNSLRIYISNSGIFNNYDFTFLASDKGPGCGGDIYNFAGIFTSPFYPQNVRNSSDCRWNIRVPNNLAVFIEFKVFDLGSKVTCHSDFVQILEQDPTSGNKDVLMRQFCGEDTPTTYVSRRNVLSLRFRKTVNFDGTGWVIQFSGIRQRFALL